jgi:hypothetical protein
VFVTEYDEQVDLTVLGLTKVRHGLAMPFAGVITSAPFHLLSKVRPAAIFGSGKEPKEERIRCDT